MAELCCCPPEAGNEACDVPARGTRRTAPPVSDCPECGKAGKPVQRQTVNALLSATLREVQEIQYLFCRTQTCPVVYFSTESEQIFTVGEIRERVYQKEPEAQDVLICYCFRHTVGDLRAASPEERIAIMDDINTGIYTGQCACDLRNPQGSCCLGNVRARIKQLEEPATATTGG